MIEPARKPSPLMSSATNESAKRLKRTARRRSITSPSMVTVRQEYCSTWLPLSCSSTRLTPTATLSASIRKPHSPSSCTAVNNSILKLVSSIYGRDTTILQPEGLTGLIPSLGILATRRASITISMLMAIPLRIPIQVENLVQWA